MAGRIESMEIVMEDIGVEHDQSLAGALPYDGGMSGYIPDDAAMSHEPEPWKRERIIRRRTMNRMQAHKDALLDLLASPLPDAERSHLTKELDDLRHDISVLGYGATDYAWEQMRNKWRNR